MDLRSYLFIYRKTQKQFAEEIGYSVQQVRKVCAKNPKPVGRKLAVAIEKATEGQVTLNDVFNPHDEFAP